MIEAETETEPSAMDERAADEDVVERGAGEGVCVPVSCVCGMRTQMIHHPRLVLQVRSSSRGLERVSVYVVKRRWWMARLSMRDKGVLGFGWEGDGVRGLFSRWCEDGDPRDGMLGIEDRIVRLEGS